MRQVLFDDDTEAESTPERGPWAERAARSGSRPSGRRPPPFWACSRCWMIAVALGWTPITIPAPSAVANGVRPERGGPRVITSSRRSRPRVAGLAIAATLAATLAGIGASWRRAKRAGHDLRRACRQHAADRRRAHPDRLRGRRHDAAHHRLGHGLLLPAPDRHEPWLPRRRGDGRRALPRARRLPLAAAGETRAAKRAALHLFRLQDRRTARRSRHADRRMDGGRTRGWGS